MTTAAVAEAPRSTAAKATSTRITSVDALRGLVMFTMIFVNDLAGVGSWKDADGVRHHIVPDWMVHFSDRHRGGSGMTFVDLVFPGFLFIVGMSIPFALGSRLNKGEPLWKTLLHVVTRTLSLLLIGILMVNGESSADAAPGWNPTLWATLLFVAAIFAFCTFTPRHGGGPNAQKIWRTLTIVLRVLGFTGLIWLAFAFRGDNDRRIITLEPFSIHTSWYGILGLIGWAYLVGSIVFLVFRTNRTALLGCMALLFCLYPADRTGTFHGFWLTHYVGIGGTLGSHAAITVAGLLLATILVAPDKRTNSARLNFTMLFIGGCAAGALLTNGLYGISKNSATPSWCLWSCAITAAVWLVFYYVCDVASLDVVAKPFAVAGQNVLLAYLISEMLPSLLDLIGLGDAYGHLGNINLACGIARSAACGAIILLITAGLNRAGFRLKL